MRYLVGILHPLRAARPHETLLLDLTNLRYLGPNGAAMQCGSVLEARFRDVQVTCRWPDGPPALLAFIEESGLKGHLEGLPVALPDDLETVTVPIRQLRESRHQDSHPILDLVARFQQVPEGLQDVLQIAFNETVQNIFDHAASAVGGFSCARYMRRDSEVRVALIDWGVGILDTLRRRYADTISDEHALQRVLFGGFSALSRRNNTGRGIDNLRTVVTEAMSGRLFILSGSGLAEIIGDRPPRYSPVNPPFRGTAVCFTLPIG